VKSALALAGLINDELRAPMQRSSEAMKLRLQGIVNVLKNSDC